MQKRCFYLFLLLCACASNEKSSNLKEKSLTNTNPSSATKILEYKANLLYESNDYPQAIKYLDSLIEMDSTNGEYYFKRGYSNGMLLKRQAAIRDYNKSIRFKYRLPDAYFNAGLNCTADNDSLALYYFEKSLPINPDNLKIIHEIKECQKRLKLKNRHNVI